MAEFQGDRELDIRGWAVCTVAGRRLGFVTERLRDPEAGDLVCLDVDRCGAVRQTYVSMRVVQIDPRRRVVLMDSADLPESELVPAGHDDRRAGPRRCIERISSEF